MTYEQAAARLLAVVTDEERTQTHMAMLARMDSSRAAQTLAQMVSEGRISMRERRDGKQGRPAHLYSRARVEAR